jgi:Tol biopolymer transport system component
MERRNKPSPNFQKRKAAMTGKSFESIENAARPEQERRLDSWKEIAAYLQRDVKTAHRWEKYEGLPVYRHHHLSRSSVYAYASELEAWRTGRGPVQSRTGWWRPVPAFASTIVIALSLMMAGSGSHIGSVVQAADGIVTRQVWAGNSTSTVGAPSPDGRYISCPDYETGNLAIRDVETGAVRQITKDGSMDSSPMRLAEYSRWSPDGKQLVYAWQGQFPTQELRIIGLDGTGPRTLYRDEKVRWVAPRGWSPDGRRILASLFTGKGVQLALISVADSTVQILRPLDPRISNTSFSPDGRYIACDLPQREGSSKHDIFLIQSDGGGETRLLEHPADDSLLGWSPDGNWLLFVSDRTGSLDLWAQRIADGKPQGAPRMLKRNMGRITPMGLTHAGSLFYGVPRAGEDVFVAEVNPETGRISAPPKEAIQRYEGANFWPEYSPDGKFLAYVSQRGNRTWPPVSGNALCVRSLETGEDREFHQEINRLGLKFILLPRWSPDSRSILFAGMGEQPGLYLIDIETGKLSTVTVVALNYCWSRDGGSIFYVKGAIRGGGGQIVRRNLGTGQEKLLREEPGGAARLMISASPDGRWLSFVSLGQEKVATLQIMPVDGGPPRDVAVLKGRPGFHTWAPDSRYILYTEGKALWRVPVSGGTPEDLGLDVKRDIRSPSVRPDGRGIVFACRLAPSNASEVWVMENFLPGSEVAAKK